MVSLSRWQKLTAPRMANTVPSAVLVVPRVATASVMTVLPTSAEPRQRGVEPAPRRRGLVATLFGLGDHLGVGLGAEARVGELGVELGDLLGKPIDLAAEPRALGAEIDHAGEVEKQRRLADHDLRRALPARAARLERHEPRQP